MVLKDLHADARNKVSSDPYDRLYQGAEGLWTTMKSCCTGRMRKQAYSTCQCSIIITDVVHRPAPPHIKYINPDGATEIPANRIHRIRFPTPRDHRKSIYSRYIGCVSNFRRLLQGENIEDVYRKKLRTQFGRFHYYQNSTPRDRLENFFKIEVSHFEIFDIGHILRAEHHTREVVSLNIMSLRKSIAAVMKTTTASTGGTRRTRADDRADIRKLLCSFLEEEVFKYQVGRIVGVAAAPAKGGKIIGDFVEQKFKVQDRREEGMGGLPEYEDAEPEGEEGEDAGDNDNLFQVLVGDIYDDL
ncbi:hypothetical protein FPQ18DRAFT_306681 [Pyronema domesticum]|nr:hypothetical protein FPQ18DRAFT_306681 [Pyronema domesticum]